MMNKSLLTNLVALTLVVVGLVLPEPWRPWVLITGLFALSGGITNWLAVYMLFERVPGFYGSGVIPLHFEAFKTGIRSMLMQQFFNREAIERFWREQSDLQVEARLESELKALVADIDYDRAFDALAESIMQSSLGNMLGMFGGKEAINGLREPFSLRMREQLLKVMDSPAVREKLKSGVAGALDSETLCDNIERLVERRLSELTPALVKQIVQEMIQQHLGWLVVWGAVIGGAVGLLFTSAGAVA